MVGGLQFSDKPKLLEAFRHEDPQFSEVAQGPSSGQPRDPSPRPYLRDQQDQPPVQGPSGLNHAVSISAVIFAVGNVLYDWNPRISEERRVGQGVVRRGSS